MMSTIVHRSVLLLFVTTSLLVNFGTALERVPNNSNAIVDKDEVCTGNKKDCEDDKRQKKDSNEWKPFRLSSRDKWIALSKLTEKYVTWHDEALKDEDIPCSKKKVVIFTPNAGLGDSIGALTSGFIYALRSGRLFFIDWHPFPWSIMFKGLPFYYDYRKALNLNGKRGKPLICPDESDASSFLSGHITNQHPLVAEAKGYDFHTDYQTLMEYFLKPSDEVEKIMADITQERFKNSEEKSTVMRKVAIVMRTGIGEYNQFLSDGDESFFVTCFKNYAIKFKESREEEWKKDGVQKKKIKFVVFVTSDNAEAKQNVINALNHGQGLNIEVVTLEDSAIHVMHMTPEESREIEFRTKLRKTIAEFLLIGMCDVKFLTHGSLFGRAAAERGGGHEASNFFLSDSNCDAQRGKYSYLKCHEPKYPPICGLS